MKLQVLNINDIVPYDRNPRLNDGAVDAVLKSIEQCTYVAPIVVDEKHVILAGHTRWKALKKLGRTECECIVKDGLTEEQKRKYRLLDNKTSELVAWDLDLLACELNGINFADLHLDWGIQEAAGDKDSPYTKVVNLPQYSVRGDSPDIENIYDSTKAEQLISEINDANIGEKEKRFLMMAAYRHVVIDFEAVAEYYAGASKEVQELMERSALVLIDYDDAIANGFTALTESLEDIREDDCDGT